MRTLLWTESARTDLATIRRYLIHQQPEYLASTFRSVIAAARFLRETPGAGSPIDGRRRKWRIGMTPYLMIYRFTNSDVFILRVQHERQNWKRGA